MSVFSVIQIRFDKIFQIFTGNPAEDFDELFFIDSTPAVFRDECLQSSKENLVPQADPETVIKDRSATIGRGTEKFIQVI